MNKNRFAVLHFLISGLWEKNPTLALMLGLCPTLAVTTSVNNALAMGIAATFVLIGSNVIISLLKNYIPNEIRIPAYIVIIAGLVTVVRLLMAAFAPALKESLGIFLALIAVNCIILGRAEAFANKHSPLESLADGLGMGLGFTLALCIIGIVREVGGAGTFFGIPLTATSINYAPKIFALAPGGFLVMGLLLGVLAWLKNRRNHLSLARKKLVQSRQRRIEAAGQNSG